MPQHKQPQTLQGIAAEQVAKMVYNSLAAIEAKYERFEWSARLQKEVGDLQEFLLSNILPLWDEVCHVLCDMYICKNHVDDNKRRRLALYIPHSLYDFRILSTFMIHDRMRKLEFTSDVCSRFRESACLSESQIVKLRNIEKIDIQYNIKLTDKMLEIIGSICNELNDIHIVLDSNHATLESLNHLLKCRELQIVDISFNGWIDKEYEPYVLKLLTDLPKLKRFYGIMDILPKLESVSSIEHLDARIHDANQLKNMLKMCPNVQLLCVINDSETHAERQKVQTFLAECTCQVNILGINKYIFDQSMGRLLVLKGRNLTDLRLCECEGSDITLNDIYVIGINCPKLEKLTISEFVNGNNERYMHPSYGSPVLPPETLIVTTPPMFRSLTHLLVSPRKGWDIRILLQILLHAKGLKSLTVINVCFQGFCDELAEILGVNPMSKLERLSFVKRFVSGVSVDSIEHLIKSCPKLNFLELSLWLKEDMWRYVKKLSREARRENLDLEVTYRETPGNDFELWLDFPESSDSE